MNNRFRSMVLYLSVFVMLGMTLGAVPVAGAAEDPAAESGEPVPLAENGAADAGDWKPRLSTQLRSVRRGWAAPLAVAGGFGVASMVAGGLMMAEHGLGFFGYSIFMPGGVMIMSIAGGSVGGVAITLSDVIHRLKTDVNATVLASHLRYNSTVFGFASGIVGMVATGVLILAVQIHSLPVFWASVAGIGTSVALGHVSAACATAVQMSPELHGRNRPLASRSFSPRILSISPLGVAGVW